MNPSRGRHPGRSRILRGMGTMAVGGLLAGCGPRPAGTEVPEAWARPEFTLAATTGRPFHFAVDTRGRPTLLLFGYTSCPDVCPGQVAAIAAARARLPSDVRSRLEVVFVTADPARDSARVLEAWLRRFDSTFVGLLGPDDAVALAADAAKVPAPIRDLDADGRPTVAHFDRVLGITDDDSVRIVIPPGVAVDGWSRTIQWLVRPRRTR